MFEFFDAVMQFFTKDIFEILQTFAVYLMTKFLVSYIKFKIFMATLAWQVGSAVLAELNITAAINLAWGQLDSTTYNAIAFFHVPEALNIILASFPAKLFLRLVGFG